MQRILDDIVFRSIASIKPKILISNEDIILNAPIEEREYLWKTAESIGINSRFHVSEQEDFESLSFECSNFLIDKENISPDELKSIVLVSQTSSTRLPSAARVLHGMLGLSSDCAAFDINDGCSGYIHAVYLASLLLDRPGDKSIIIAGDIISKHISPSDFSNQLLMGDGIAVTIIEKVERGESCAFILGSDGKNADKIKVCSDTNFFEMEGFDVFAFTMQILPTLLEQTLALSNFSINQVDLFYMHQANNMIMDKFEKKMKLDPHKVPRSISTFANTGPASIPITISNSKNENPKTVCMLGFGAGLSWGSLLTKNFNPKVYSL